MNRSKRPEEPQASVSTEPERVATGPAAVATTLKRAFTQMGATRSGRTLLKVNQPDGFDCPGCAWPEPPPGERKTAEFCENGAKAIAEEATTERADPNFFRANSIKALRTWSDFALGRAGRLTDPMLKRPGASHFEPVPWDDALELVASKSLPIRLEMPEL